MQGCPGHQQFEDSAPPGRDIAAWEAGAQRRAGLQGPKASPGKWRGARREGEAPGDVLVEGCINEHR